MKLNRVTIKAFARSFAKDDEGATAIEYGLFAALVGAVIVGTVATLGQQTNSGFSEISAEMTNAGIEADAAPVEEQVDG
ncbi:Flp family type IVb pilin [Rhodobacterales bacterium HKCCE4037]|nr:Flp family type IVb pilin [Rhodobacterales bacterium HKCCE4037]